MIERLQGTYVAALPRGIVVDVGGVGYGLDIPLSAYAMLPAVGETLSLWVHTHVREDAIKLFGFLSYTERMAFEILIGLNGVGPKVALAILSTLTVEQLKRAILHDRDDVLLNVPGIGKRLAEKIFVELKPKIKKLNAATVNFDNPHGEVLKSETLLKSDLIVDEEDVSWAVFEDVRSALENLGFKEKAINDAFAKMNNSKEGSWTFHDLLRESLSKLGSHKLDKVQAKEAPALDRIF